MSRMLGVFKELYETVRRIVALIKNIIYQMNGLFNGKYKLYVNSFKKHVYFEAFNNLGHIMSTLYVIDMIINENSNFKTYWEDYNKMFLVCKNDVNRYGTTEKDIKKITKFCTRIYTQILCGQLYTNNLDLLSKVILEETGKEMLFKNKEFAAKYLEYLNKKIVAVEFALSNPGDLKSHLEYFYLLVHYSIYRKLFANEDAKLYKQIWALQKRCPVIVVYNNLTLNPGKFLVNVCPLKKKTTVDPRDIGAFY